MIEVTNYKKDGKKSGSVSLPDDLFSLPWNDELIHQVVTSIVKNSRTGNAHTKGRGEVSGGGKKPWRQKGTGRARAGSTRSPIWVGGGTTFGPSTEKKYVGKINKKMKAKAFFTVLSEKVRNNNLSFVEDFTLEKPSTKSALSFLKNVCGDDTDNKKNSCIIVTADNDSKVIKSFSNVFGVNTIGISSLGTKDALVAKKIVFINPEKTLEHLNKRGELAKNKKTI